MISRPSLQDVCATCTHIFDKHLETHDGLFVCTHTSRERSYHYVMDQEDYYVLKCSCLGFSVRYREPDLDRLSPAELDSAGPWGV